jgi:hypothetical protein
MEINAHVEDFMGWESNIWETVAWNSEEWYLNK